MANPFAQPVEMRPLLLAMDIEHDRNVVAQQWVQQFNEAGGYVIQEYTLRKPTESEIEQAKKYTKAAEIVKKGDEWFTQAKVSGKIVTKIMFVLDIKKAERLPMDLEKLKLLKAEEKLNSVKGVGKK